MKKYLIDTNIAIFYMKGKFGLEKKFGVAKSEKPAKNRKALNNFLTGIQILPIFHSLDLYAKEKARLQKAGIPIDDFDILIGTT